MCDGGDGVGRGVSVSGFLPAETFEQLRVGLHWVGIGGEGGGMAGNRVCDVGSWAPL